jgi:hypothetical protein
MSERNTGGSAFPCLPPQDTAAGSAVGYPFPESGMTLRDYFAAKALQGLLAHPECDFTPMTAAAQEQAAADAYGMADAMLAAREAA